jgi:DNA-binding cell septation regulator SpoVG
MQVEFKVEPSQSGKTCGIAIHKKGEDKPFLVVKGCRIATGQNGPFLSGPSAKMDNGEWLNYLFTSKEFGGYITELALKALDKPAKAKPTEDSDIPF